jgi:hypothetical protein
MRNHSPFCPWSTQCPEPEKEAGFKKAIMTTVVFWLSRGFSEYIRGISPLGTFVELVVNHNPCMYVQHSTTL